jgi:hypothetical protein
MPPKANARSFKVRFCQSRGQSGMALVQSIQYQGWEFIHVKSRHITFISPFLSLYVRFLLGRRVGWKAAATSGATSFS